MHNTGYDLLGLCGEIWPGSPDCVIWLNDISTDYSKWHVDKQFKYTF